MNNKRTVCKTSGGHDYTMQNSLAAIGKLVASIFFLLSTVRVVHGARKLLAANVSLAASEICMV